MEPTPTAPSGPERARPSESMVRRALDLVGYLEPREYSQRYEVDKRALDALLLRSAAASAGMDVVELNADTSLVSSGGAAWVVHKNMPSWLTGLDRAVTNNKHLTKQVLAGRGLPVAHGQVVTTFEQAREVFGQMPHPVVTKPVTGSGGQGVTVDIRTEAELEAACADIVGRGRSIVLEEMVNGIDLRIMTIAGRAVAASLRVPANVIGDGRRTVAELVEAKNEVRSRNPYTRHSPIALDDAAHARLAAQGMAAQSVPPAGQRVLLHLIANVSSGGDCYEVHDHVHPDLLRLAEQAAACFPSATHAGMDILAERLDTGLDAQRAIISEVNLNNEIPMHIMPTYGASTNVHEALIGAGPGPVSPVLPAGAGAAGTVDVAHLDDLIAAAGPLDLAPADPGTAGREVDTHQLREQFEAAGYDGVDYRGALVFLSRGPQDLVVHRSGRSVVSREVARRPEVLEALADALGIPSMSRTDLQQEAAPSGRTCHLLLIEGEIAAMLLSPSGGNGPDGLGAAGPGTDDGHGSDDVSGTIGLAQCPFPELAQYAAALRAPLGPTPIVSLSFGLRPEAGSGQHTWALWAIDPDPVLATFAYPHAGVAADLYPAAAAALLRADHYVLPREDVSLPGQS